MVTRDPRLIGSKIAIKLLLKILPSNNPLTKKLKQIFAIKNGTKNKHRRNYAPF